MTPADAAPVRVSRANARRFLVHAFGLNGYRSLGTVANAVQTLGFVQQDSINVCGRMHDLILENRVPDYTPADLHRYLYEQTPRPAFEYYLPNLCVLPVADFPYFAPVMRSRRDAEGRYGKLSPEEQAAADTLLARIDATGAVFLRDTKADGAAHGHTTSGWGTKTRLLSFVADKLFWQGILGIARRENFLRGFDRLENLLPASVLNAPPVPDAEAEVFRIRKKLRAARLFRLSAASRAALNHGETTAVFVEGDPRPWHVFTDDLPHLWNPAPVAPALHLLAPLDPLIYDRARTRLLWDFEYTWEVYVPEAKRKWGYYVLPILHGDRLVGRVEPRRDRATGAWRVVSLQWEPGEDATEAQALLNERFLRQTNTDSAC